MLTSSSFYSTYVKLADDLTPPELAADPKLGPFLKHCRGAIDGSHINYYALKDEIARCRDRKGNISQNVLIAADWKGQILYCLPGWEGSANDGLLWNHASRNGLELPKGQYFLADAGFTSCDALLVPYRATRYHLKEFARGNTR